MSEEITYNPDLAEVSHKESFLEGLNEHKAQIIGTALGVTAPALGGIGLVGLSESLNGMITPNQASELVNTGFALVMTSPISAIPSAILGAQLGHKLDRAIYRVRHPKASKQEVDKKFETDTSWKVETKKNDKDAFIAGANPATFDDASGGGGS